ncbi:UNVERIFIED_CONTAM: DUF2833 domain-containing protein [Kocuria sp. CPCC 205274]
MHIRKATEEDVHNFIHHVSESDVAEFDARQPHRNLLEVMLEHLDDNSVVCVDDEGFIYAYGGNEENCVWFLTSQALTDSSTATKKEFIKQISSHRDSLLKQYDYLFNFVWSENL